MEGSNPKKKKPSDVFTLLFCGPALDRARFLPKWEREKIQDKHNHVVLFALGRTVIHPLLHLNTSNDIVVRNRSTRSRVTNQMTKTAIHRRTTMMKTKVGRQPPDNRGVQYLRTGTSFSISNLQQLFLLHIS